MICKNCGLTYYSWAHVCEVAHFITEKPLGLMSSAELDEHYTSQLNLTEEDRELLKGMLIGV